RHELTTARMLTRDSNGRGRVGHRLTAGGDVEPAEHDRERVADFVQRTGERLRRRQSRLRTLALNGVRLGMTSRVPHTARLTHCFTDVRGAPWCCLSSRTHA